MNANTSRRAMILGISAATLVFPTAALPADDPKVAGTWTLVSAVNTQPDGQKIDVFGTRPNGRAIFTSDGNFTVLFSRDGLPKFASGNRQKGTPEENQAVVQGSLGYAGTYTVDPADKSLVMKVEVSTFPAWIGETQKRKYTVDADQLQWVGIVGTGGGNMVLTLKRMK